MIKTENTMVIEYDDLCNKTYDIIDGVYAFLNLPKFKHRLDNLNQLDINGISYNDNVWLGEYHTIRKSVDRNQYDVKDYLPKSVINKYRNLN